MVKKFALNKPNLLSILLKMIFRKLVTTVQEDGIKRLDLASVATIPEYLLKLKVRSKKLLKPIYRINSDFVGW
jgi:hypothetical protein